MIIWMRLYLGWKSSHRGLHSMKWAPGILRELEMGRGDIKARADFGNLT